MLIHKKSPFQGWALFILHLHYRALSSPLVWTGIFLLNWWHPSHHLMPQYQPYTLPSHFKQFSVKSANKIIASSILHHPSSPLSLSHTHTHTILSPAYVCIEYLMCQPQFQPFNLFCETLCLCIKQSGTNNRSEDTGICIFIWKARFVFCRVQKYTTSEYL